MPGIFDGSIVLRRSHCHCLFDFLSCPATGTIRSRVQIVSAQELSSRGSELGECDDSCSKEKSGVGTEKQEEEGEVAGVNSEEETEYVDRLPPSPPRSHLCEFVWISWMTMQVLFNYKS